MTRFQDGTILTSQAIDCQLHAIGKTIRLLFADSVTLYLLHLYGLENYVHQYSDFYLACILLLLALFSRSLTANCAAA